jgi:hypothetical protein
VNNVGDGASYRQDAEVAFENMGRPWMLQSWGLVRPCISNSSRERSVSLYSEGYRAQHNYSAVSSVCTLAWFLWKATFGLR